jgi:hypothetical protein
MFGTSNAQALRLLSVSCGHDAAKIHDLPTVRHGVNVIVFRVERIVELIFEDFVGVVRPLGPLWPRFSVMHIK